MTTDEIQALSRQILLNLHMLTRSVRIYSTDNAIFLKPLHALLEQINRIVQMEGKIDLALVGLALYVNGRLIRVDQTLLESLKNLALAFGSHGVGGFSIAGTTTLEELRHFFAIFASEGRPGEVPPEDGIPGHRLDRMRLRPWSDEQEKRGPQATKLDPAEKRAQQALAAYARALVWAEYQTRCAKEGRAEDATSASTRIAQDLVDLVSELKEHLLPLLVNGEGTRALAYHLVNAAIVAVIFGLELGMSKVQLKDLAVAALTSEVLLATLPPSQWLPADPDKLPAEQQAGRAALWRETASRALRRGRAGSRLHQFRALAALQMHEPYLASVREAAGPKKAKARDDVLFAARVLAIVSHFDALTSPSGERAAAAVDQALGALWGPLRLRFDAELLWVFVRVMARLPVKVMPRAAGGIVDA